MRAQAAQCRGTRLPVRRRTPIASNVARRSFQQRSFAETSAEQQVGMAAEIFRAGLDRDIDAARMRREEQRRRPGVVHQHDRVARMRDRRDRRNVLHLERQRARRLGEHRARIRLEQLRDIGADQRVVVGRLDAEALQHRVAKIARRAIDRVGDQQVVARFEAGQQRDRNRREPRGDQHRPGRTAQLAPGDLERLGRRRALGAVGVARLALRESPARSDKAPSNRDRSAYSRSRAVPSGSRPAVDDLGGGLARLPRAMAAAVLGIRFIDVIPCRPCGRHLLRQRGPAVNPLTLLGDRSQMRHSGAAWEFVR